MFPLRAALALLVSLALVPSPALATPVNDAEEADALPTVLLLGDSISVGYAPLVRERLAGVATVRFAETDKGRPRNLGNTRGGLKALRSGWVPEGPWDLIHFNFGQNDFAYRNKALPPGAPGRLDKKKGAITVPVDEYEANLRTLVGMLQRSSTTLLWASSTIVPEDEPARFPGDEVRYNDVAARVMKENGVRTHDLHALTSTFPVEMFIGPGDVHYGPAGSARLADQIAAEIRATLAPAAAADADAVKPDPAVKRR